IYLDTRDKINYLSHDHINPCIYLDTRDKTNYLSYDDINQCTYFDALDKYISWNNDTSR
ncbi:hypothetical protein GGI43DRAFT_396343, partial [Trichoderma evansii]